MLESVTAGRTAPSDALKALRSLGYEDAGVARLDHHRHMRQGFPEVIYCAGKTPEQVAIIARRLVEAHDVMLGTRATTAHATAVKEVLPDAQYDVQGRTLVVDRRTGRAAPAPGVALVAAGTSDIPVAQEAAITLRVMGHEPLCIYDVGVAGLQRVLCHVKELQDANVVIVVAGMEGALPSVVGGLTGSPVIAVPTSVGYGASFGGVAALLGMLNSCSSGVAVMNIDNGFGAAHLAARINARIARGPAPTLKGPLNA